jgi:CRISPR-associated endonuclease/helicase Cas3
LPEIVPPNLATRAHDGETRRVCYKTLGRLSGSDGIAAAIEEHADTRGGSLVVMNTVQSAAVMTKKFAQREHDVLHLSTALCPRDRSSVMDQVEKRLKENDGSPWLLVATSLVEAGVDLSFQTAFRERFSVSSLIQIGGRVNRHGGDTRGTVYDFFCDTADLLVANPAAKSPARVLEDFWKEGRFANTVDASQLTTLALRRELADFQRTDKLSEAELDLRYPDVAKLGRIIDCDSRLVVVDPLLRDLLFARRKVGFRKLLEGSVQIQGWKLRDLGLTKPIITDEEVYWWPHKYEPTGLGYMAGALELRAIENGTMLIV